MSASAAKPQCIDVVQQHTVLETVLNTIPHRIFWKDCNLVYCGCNQAFAEQFGFSNPNELIGITDYDLPVSTEEAEFYRSCDRRVIETGEQLFDIEEPATLADGSTITVLTSKILLRDAAGEVIGVLGSFLDITERKQLELQLAQAQKLESIGQLAAGLAHEINTPMQFVRDNIDFVAEASERVMSVLQRTEELLESAEPMGWEERKQEIQQLKDQCRFNRFRTQIQPAVDDSQEGIQRIVKIVTAMKDFSHPGAEGMSPVDINQLVDSTVEITRNKWKYIAAVELDLCNTLPPVVADAAAFNQALLNLVVNAADAIEERFGEEEHEPSAVEGRIGIATRYDGENVVVEVSDNGSGIPDDRIGKIFDMFFTTKPVGKGTGQGLSIVHSVISQQHNGQIDVRSEVGTGTTFILRIPLEQPTSDAGDL